VRRSRLCLVFLLFLSVSALLVAHGQAELDAKDLITEGDQLFNRWGEEFDFVFYKEQLQSAITLWETALPFIPDDQTQTKARVLNRLSQSYFELAEGYLATKAEKEETYERGKDAALESLRLDPDFVRTEKEEGFRAALRFAKDIAAIFWYGNNLGQWLNYHQLTAIMGGVRDVLASFERSVELDETFDGGGPHRALAAFLAQAYFVVGRSRDDSLPHFERSIEIDPDYLENYVNYAEFYAKPVKDWDLFNELLETALEKARDPIVMAKWPFYNRLAVDRACGLRERQG